MSHRALALLPLLLLPLRAFGEQAVLVGSWGGGLFRLPPGEGAAWEPYGANLPQPYVRFVAADPKGALYCGFGGKKLYLSRDFGKTWETTETDPPEVPSGVAFHPGEPSTFVMTSWGGGLWWSQDGGKTWERGEAPSPFMRGPVSAMAGRNPAFWAVAGDNRIVSSRGVKGTWQQQARLTRGLNAWNLAVRDAGKGLLLAATDAGVAEVGADGTVKFPKLGNLPAAFVRAVAVDDERVLLGTWGDGVIEWTPKGARAVNAGLGDRNVFGLALLPASAVGKAEAVTASVPTTWTAWNAGLLGTGVACLAMNPSNPQILYCGTTSGIHKSTDGGRSWTPINTGLTTQSVGRIAISPANPDYIYTSCWGSGCQRSKNGGQSWEQANKGLTTSDLYWIDVDKANPNTVYANSWGAGVFRSEDGADSWKDFNSGLASVNGYFVASLPLDPKPVIASLDAAGLYLLSNGKWTDANKGMTSQWVMYMAQSPHNGKLLAVVTAGAGAFISEDAGASWKQSNKGLTSQEGKAVAFHPGKPGVVYVGTDGSGVFKSTDNGASWTQDNAGLTSMKVVDIVISPTGLVYLATENGVFVRQD